jgi:hypothetical protein
MRTRKARTVLADALIDLAAEAIAKWVREQIRLRYWVHGGGVAGVYHAPDAIR